MNYVEIGQRIRRFRKACGLSQEALAEKVNISTTHMSHIETGSTKLSLPVLVDIAAVLNVRTDDILQEEPSKSASAIHDELAQVLCSCSAPQARILLDIMKTAKQAMEKYQ